MITEVALTASSGDSIISQVLIGADQYLAVTDPLQYHERVNKTKCFILCFISKIFILTFVSTHAFILSLAVDFMPIFNIISFSLLFMTPFMIIAYFYAKVFFAAHENSVKTRRNSVCSGTFDAINNNNNDNVMDEKSKKKLLSPDLNHCDSRRSSVKSNASSIRRKLSNASAVLFYREESRAAKVSMIVLATIVLCWISYFSSLFIPNLSHTHILWTRMLTAFSPVITPMIYAFRSKRVQRDVKRTFGFVQRRTKNRKRKFGAISASSVPKVINCANNAKMQRMKSFSCPQLLISSVDEVNSEITSSTFLTNNSNNFQNKSLAPVRKFAIGSVSPWSPKHGELSPMLSHYECTKD